MNRIYAVLHHRRLRTRWSIAIGLTVFLFPGTMAAAAPSGTVETATFESAILPEAILDIEATREIRVYLPPGYADSEQRYPVIYYCHSLYWDNARLFESGAVKSTLDRAIANGVIAPFIFVAGDFAGTSNAGCFFENSPVSGRWIDHVIEELVPFIDNRYRTLAERNSRAIVGDLIGGYGALKLAMMHPDVFSVVYALHPAAAGTGYLPMTGLADWQRMHDAPSFESMADDVYSQVFTSMAQAYLPNPNRPPLYCDFMQELQDGEMRLHVANSERLKNSFLLDHLLPAYADNLRQLNGIKFDWGRYDQNYDHVWSNQAFTRQLEELGIEHEAEEYRGNTWNQNWTEYGRVYADLLPFLARHLATE